MTFAWAAVAVGLAWYVASAAAEVTYVTLADGRRQARSLPVVFKALLPFVGNLDPLVSRPFFAKRISRIDRTLVSAGFEGLLSGREFVALEMLCPIFPWIWLRGELRRRHASIMKSLPFVLDLLTLSVEAGMDFMSALQRNCQSRRMDALNEELLRTVREIQLGASRRDALKSMSDRVDQPDLRSLAHALVQADEFGVSVGSVLRIQSGQLRSRRFDRAEKLAAEAPTKMLGPLMLFIFPAVFVILLGPVLVQALDGIM